MANKLLLIGIDKYENRKQLNNCVRDLIDFRDILIEKYDFDENDITELFDSDATNLKIQDTFKAYIKSIDKTDSLVIFYSGHGEYDEYAKTGYWVPFDGNDKYPSWITNEAILSYLNLINAKHIFLISDSCFSTSILNILTSKSNAEYSNRPSRWGLASAFKESYDAKQGENSEFADAIIRFITNKEKDFRVTELIEFVKTAFSFNVKQKPQGSPLMLSGHNGGEMLFTVKQETDTRKFKGYKDFKKTLQLYKRNEFKEIATFEDRTNKVGFSLFQEYDEVKKKITHYLYLYEGLAQNKTLNYLKSNHKEIFSKDLIILLTKERSQVNIEVRKNNIEKKFNPLSCYYIDDFIRLYCTPKLKSEDNTNFLNLSNFVLPSFDSKSQQENIEQFIFDWFKTDDDPILVVIGAGGIGKTTFAQFIADKILKINSNTFVMFIDSVLIKDGLLKRKRYFEDINLYNFYEALYELTDMYHEKLNEDLFRINLDAGNILLIIDGLDEVISKIPNFNANKFLKSISSTSDAIGGGKVIITCRTHFWDTTELLDSNFNTIELLPFNYEQTNEFFKRSFSGDSTKVRKALKIADEFKYPDSENIFHPYVLDIVKSIIQTDNDDLDADLTEFSSKFLKSSVNSDYIIYRICDRERKRIGQISVDDQITFFIYLATVKRGVIDIENLKPEIHSALAPKHIDKTNVEAFKAHPFLHIFDRTCRFKYDFLTDYFRGVYLTDYFEFDKDFTTPTDLFISLISETCWFGSPISKDIASRIKHWDEDDLFFIADIIEKIGSLDRDDSIKWKAVATIFNVCLTINGNKRSPNIEDNTNLMLSLFQSTKGKLFNLSIINLNNPDFKIRFNFSNLTIIKGYFDNYGNFWDCAFNESTIFSECYLMNLVSKRSKELALSETNFHDCITDDGINAVLTSNKENQVDKKGKAKAFLDDFFHLFLSNGKLERQSENDVIKTRFGGINKSSYNYKRVVKTLKSRFVIETYDNKTGPKMEILNEFREDVYRFVKDGTMSKIIATLIEDFTKI